MFDLGVPLLACPAVAPTPIPKPDKSLGRLLQRLGRHDEAIECLTARIERAADDAIAHLGVAQLYETTGRPAQAVRHYRRALQLRPDWPVAANNLAWLFATHPDAAIRNATEAVRLARIACDATNLSRPHRLGHVSRGLCGKRPFQRCSANLANGRGTREACRQHRPLRTNQAASDPLRTRPTVSSRQPVSSRQNAQEKSWSGAKVRVAKFRATSCELPES